MTERELLSDCQLADVAGVVAVQRERLDQAYLRRWADHLGVRSMLENVLSGRPPLKST